MGDMLSKKVNGPPGMTGRAKSVNVDEIRI